MRGEWNQPICETCWVVWSYLQFGGFEVPYRLLEGEQHELCVFCNRDTDSGIYVRVDPSAVLRPGDKRMDYDEARHDAGLI